LIRHTGLEFSMPAAFAIGTLPVTVIEPPFGTLLVPPIGAPTLLDSGLLAAGPAAIPLPSIAVRAEKKQRSAFAAEANP
jgi:hypothetical protein